MKKGIVFFLVLVVALALRLLYIDNSLWYDEACSWVTAQQNFPFGITDNLLHTDLQHTPLYFFFLHFWMKIFGQSEIPLRIFSLIFGIGTIPLVYTFANKFAGKKTAIVSMMICSFSTLMSIFSVEVRMYSLVTFLVILSLNYLADFEYKQNNLWKLVCTNILIPYTFVGGIFYNIGLFLCYGTYLFKYNNEKFKTYIKAGLIENICLIPFWILIIYYAVQRTRFVIAHEGSPHFMHIVDIIRNFYGIDIASNIYWPSESYIITFAFTVLTIIPCVYFVNAYIKGLKIDNKFQKCLYTMGITIFGLFIFTSLCQVNVLTVRYIIYLYPVVITLSVFSLTKILNKKHFTIFILLFLLFSGLYNTIYAQSFSKYKTFAFKDVANEAKKLELTSDDVVIMPFGSDAPYYFRSLISARVYDYDFHKQLRNPKNNRYYDKEQQEKMDNKNKYETIYDMIEPNYIIPQNYYNDFVTNITSTIPKNRFVLLAMYNTDNNAIGTIEQIRLFVKDKKNIKKYFLTTLFRKYLSDTLYLLGLDFNLVKSYKQGNYTYYLFQKK